MPYIEPAEIERVKRIDALSYLQQCEPDELVRLSANSYCTRTHDSLKLSANGCFYWWSRGLGGRSALDYLIKVKGMTFLDAVARLGAKEMETPRRRTQQAPSIPRAKRLVLPVPARLNDAAIAYLKLRGIDPRIISRCVKDGVVYQAEKGNATIVVFVGKDRAGTPRYAALRGTSGDYKGEAQGSDKRFAFRLASHSDSNAVHVFEGAIDALSFATLALDAKRDWQTLNLLSLGGVSPATDAQGRARLPAALNQYLTDNPKTKRVLLHLDNDTPGLVAANMISSVLKDKNYDVSVAPPSQGKDDYLMTRRKRHMSEAMPRHEKPQNRDRESR